jgi:lipoyl(octanoyl) transferase
MSRIFTSYWLGSVPYGEAHALQERLVQARVDGHIGDSILLLEHPSVITLGRGASMSDVLVDQSARVTQGVELFETGRGGQVTAHAPGQLVAYPIVDLKPDRCDVRKYIRDLGEVMVRLARDHDVNAAFVPAPAEHIGVWVPNANGASEKIGAIGVRLSRWVTMHGFALNVSTDLSIFDMIVPCGVRDHGVTSLHAHGKHHVTVESLVARTAEHFGEVFSAESQVASPDAARALRLGTPSFKL